VKLERTHEQYLVMEREKGKAKRKFVEDDDDSDVEIASEVKRVKRDDMAARLKKSAVVKSS
jgi:hypothetical protein